MSQSPAQTYNEKLAAKLRAVESAVAQAESVGAADAAPAAGAAADSKGDEKSDVKSDAAPAAAAAAPAAVEDSASPSARAYANRIRDRLSAAAHAVNTPKPAAAAAAAPATPAAAASSSPRTTTAAPAAAGATPASPKRIVLGPTVRDAVTRLTNGFELLIYGLSDEQHRVCTRRAYTLWFSPTERALCWAAGSAKLLVASQRVPVSELTHIYFGAQTKAFDFAYSSVGGAAVNSGLCVSLLTPKATLDIEALNKADFRAFLACLNTVLESYGKLTFLERGSGTDGTNETRRFRIVPAADLDDDPLQLSASGSVASAGPAPLTAANVGGLPTVWIAPNNTRMVFPANVGKNGFRTVSGQPLNSDITALSRSAVPFHNPHLNALEGRAAPLRIHMDPHGLTEAAALHGSDGETVVLNDGTGAAAALAGDETLFVEDDDSDSDDENDVVHTAGRSAAGAAAAAPAAAQINSVASLLPQMPVVVQRPAAAPAAAAAAKPAAPPAGSVAVKRTDALAGALLQGLVWKAAGVFKRWESRYVALVGRFVFKYDTPHAPLGATLGHPLPLDLCTFEPAGEIAANKADPTKGPAYLFRVTYNPVGGAAGGAAREWVFGVSSEAVRANWLKALSIAKPLIVAKVSGKRAWTAHDVEANKVAALAYETH